MITALFDLASSPLVQRLAWVLAHSLWQGAIIGLLLALVLPMLRRSAANARYLAGCVALALLAAAPVATFIGLPPDGPAPRPSAREPQLSAEAGTASSATRDPAALAFEAVPKESAGQGWLTRRSHSGEQVDDSRVPAARALPLALPRVAAWMSNAAPWLVIGWLGGVAALSLRMMAGWIAVQNMKRRCTSPVVPEARERLARIATVMGVSRPVRLLASALAEVPLVIGWLRPAILLPASLLAGLPPTHVEAILAHELAHIRRHDYFVNLLQSAIETVLFYHPLVWWISARIRDERENACDDLAVEVCGDVLTYAQALTTLEEMRSAPMLLATAANGGALLGRIRRLLGIPTQRQRQSSWWVAGFVTALFATAAAATILAPARAATRAAADIFEVTPSHRPAASAAQTDELDVAGDSRASLTPLSGMPDLAELCGALGVDIWRFQVAVPSSADSIAVAIECFTDGQGVTPLATIVIAAPVPQAGQAAIRNITLSIAPLNGGAGEDLTNAQNLIVRCGRASETLRNPFRRRQSGVLVAHTPRKIDPTTFQLMIGGDRYHELRVRITPSLQKSTEQSDTSTADHERTQKLPVSPRS